MIKLTNYDVSQYKIFEDKLNNLSTKGYNCNSVDRFTHFKQDNQRYYYHTDIFIPDKDIAKTNRQQRDDFLLNYVNAGYKYLGKSGKIHVFRSKNKLAITGTKNALLLNYFKKNRTMATMIYNFIAMLLAFILLPSVFTNLNPSEFITNGAIIIHYLPLLFTIAVLFLTTTTYYNTEKMKQILKKKKQTISSKHLFISNTLLIATLVFFIGGLALDSIERKELPVNNSLLSLESLGLASGQDTYNTYMQSSSLLIKKSYSYLEMNPNKDILKVNYYQYADNNKATHALNEVITRIDHDKKKKVTDGYLLMNDKLYDSYVFVVNKQLVVIQASFDLNNYQSMIKAQF